MTYHYELLWRLTLSSKEKKISDWRTNNANGAQVGAPYYLRSRQILMSCLLPCPFLSFFRRTCIYISQATSRILGQKCRIMSQGLSKTRKRSLSRCNYFKPSITTAVMTLSKWVPTNPLISPRASTIWRCTLALTHANFLFAQISPSCQRETKFELPARSGKIPTLPTSERETVRGAADYLPE